MSIADETRTTIDSNHGKGNTITLEVEDIEKTFLFLVQAGLNPTPVKDHTWGAKVVHIYDPEGNRIEFWCSNIGLESI